MSKTPVAASTAHQQRFPNFFFTPRLRSDKTALKISYVKISSSSSDTVQRRDLCNRSFILFLRHGHQTLEPGPGATAQRCPSVLYRPPYVRRRNACDMESGELLQRS